MAVIISDQPSPSAVNGTDKVQDANDTIRTVIDSHGQALWGINRTIHENPELGYKEFQAHDNIVSLIQSKGFKVTEHAYGIGTSFSAESGAGGRVITFVAEYDALPGIGHACGHNLIATAAIASFFGVAEALKRSGIKGRVRLLGAPAEENAGGKIELVNAGAFDDVDACLMLHPGAESRHNSQSGSAYLRTLANEKVRVHFLGKPAHASMAPHQGINALDAVTLAYTAISMLRQQIRPYERVHSIITDGGDVPNVIPERASAFYVIRSSTVKEVEELKKRIIKCFEGAAIATGCSFEVENITGYSDLGPNKSICKMFACAMLDLGSPVNCDLDSKLPGLGSTDMGNVSYVCPSFHGFFGIPTEEGAYNHTPGFTKFAGTQKAHDLTIVVAKAMAIAGWKVLENETAAAQVWQDFEEDEATRRRIPQLK